MLDRQFLIVDADDTLWENNIYFERAFDDFARYLDHSSLTHREIRDVLDAIEAVNAKIHGYGSKNFGRNLVETYHQLCQRPIEERDLARVVAFAERILEQPVEPIAGVRETLEYLAPRHELTLFTKGHPDEQRMKIDRSGFGPYFAHTAIVKEKDPDSYRALIESRQMAPERTWMIGNSPKSDINPALACGIHAVFIPHAHTWVLERQEIVGEGPGRLLELASFAELRDYF